MDIIGKALEDYFFHSINEKIVIHSPDFDDDEIAVSWYFRSFAQMPEIERKAIYECKGKILDLGAGAGSHSLVLKEKDMEVVSMDTSMGACKVMKSRGLENVLESDVYSAKTGNFDTVLMMMNGIGICSNISGLEKFLDFLPSILNEGGQLIFDSSNLIYLFQDEEGIAEINIAADYYGEIDFQMEYKGQTGEYFKWLYIDFDTITAMCEKRNYRIKLLAEGDNLQYLASIFL